MAAPRFLVDQGLEPDLEPGTEIPLPQSTAHHIIHVLRLRQGDAITLFSGEGGQYQAAVASISRSRAVARLDGFEAIERESSLITHLGIAVIRKQAMDAALVRANELGVTHITPLLTEHVSVSRRHINENHWQDILGRSCEQCGRNRLPRLHRPRELDDWLDSADADVRVVAHPHDSHPAGDLPGSARSAALLIGPEGGLAGSEVAAAQSRGFFAVSLGPRILRAETVPAVLLTLAQYHWGDLRDPPV
jgi:16S rRNA (uracil1498-N3)-methyltransferase